MFEAAQAVHSEESGPRVPSTIDTHPAPMFGSRDGIENGPTRSGPLSIRTLWQSWKLFRPPMPVAMDAPIRSASAATSMPESRCAWMAAASTIWVKRSILRELLRSIQSVGVEALDLAPERDRILARDRRA